MGTIKEFKYSKSRDNKDLSAIASWLDSVGFSRSSSKVLKNDMEYIFLHDGNELRIRKDIEFYSKFLPISHEYESVILRVDEEGKIDVFNKTSYENFWHVEFYIHRNRLTCSRSRYYQYGTRGYFDFSNPTHQRCIYNAINRGLRTKKPLPFIYDPKKNKPMVYETYSH